MVQDVWHDMFDTSVPSVNVLHLGNAWLHAYDYDIDAFSTVLSITGLLDILFTDLMHMYNVSCKVLWLEL